MVCSDSSSGAGFNFNFKLKDMVAWSVSSVSRGNIDHFEPGFGVFGRNKRKSKATIGI